MDKAEELAKQIALIRDFSWELTTTETQNAIIRTIEQYATEVSRETRMCHSCGNPLSNECPRCKRLWAS